MTIVAISSASGRLSATTSEIKVASVAPSAIVRLKPTARSFSTRNSKAEILLLPSIKYSTSPGAGSLFTVTGRNIDKPPAGAG